MMERRSGLLTASLSSKLSDYEQAELDELEKHCYVHRSIIEFLENCVSRGTEADRELNEIEDIEMGLVEKENEE